MKCPACAEEIPKGSKVCPSCNENLAGGGGNVISPEKAAEIKAKISRTNMLSFVFAIPGLLLQFAAGAIVHPTTVAEAQMVPMIQLAGGILLIIGLCLYASMKGRSPAWGLMGLLSCLGLIFLAIMAKICQNCGLVGGRNDTECKKCQCPM